LFLLRRTCLIGFALLLLISNRESFASGAFATDENSVNKERLVFSGLSDSAFNILCEAVIVEAYARVGREASVVLLPGKRRLSVSSSGELDGDTNLTKRASNLYPTLIRVAVPYLSLNWHLYVRHEFKDKAKSLPLEKMRLGVLRGLLYTNELTKGMEPVEANGVFQLFNLLSSNRVDAVISTDFTGDIILAHKFRNQRIEKIIPPLSSEPVFHYLQSKHADLVPEITLSLQEMFDTGRIDEIKRDLQNRLSEAGLEK
jgi:polar amino acid transport system substrate-binding protein